jgi:hypothetical protein
LALSLPELDVCPECGNFCDAPLNESTGWCSDCSPPVCNRCGGPRTSDHKLCISCQRLQWIERNADQLEEYIALGFTFSEAKRKITSENRAICVVCTSPIPGKHKKNTLFCKKNEECRKARWRYLERVKQGKPKAEALEEALREGAHENIN